MFCTILISGEIGDRANAVISSLFGQSAKYEFRKVRLSNSAKSPAEKTAGQRFFTKTVHATAVLVDDTTAGYAVIDNVKGKAMPITFMVLFDASGNVIQVEVLKYREAYGGEISHPNWLSQYGGYSSSSPFKVGKDIDGISGATISVRAINSGIYKLVLTFDAIRKQLEDE